MLTYFNYFSAPVKKRGLYTYLIVFASYLVVSQNGISGHPEWFLKPSVNQGFILEHRSTIGHLVKGYPTIYGLDIGKPTLGNKLWHYENNKPDLGLSLTVLDFKNPKQLGYAISIAPFIDIPMSRIERMSRVTMRLCWGVGYLNKSFDINSNHKNIAIGSRVNSFVQFKWFWQIPLSEKLHFEPGFAFTHASNARAKVPNLGLNVISLNAALRFQTASGTAKNTIVNDSTTRALTKYEIAAYASFGYNQREVATDYLYNLHFSAAFHRNVRNTHKIGLGTDIFFDQNYMIDYRLEKNENPRGFDQARVAVKFCYSYNVGRISFPFETGYYVFQKVNPDGPVVSRIGVRYYSRCGLIASVGLRTHFAVAYDFEYGLGYRFNL